MNKNTIAAHTLLLFSCFFLKEHAFADTTDAPHHDPMTFGYLKVFSSTQESSWGEGSTYYIHSGYRIYDASGKLVKWVENHDSNRDEEPEKVVLIPGAYTIWAQSDKEGYVKMPVVIKNAQITKVQLEKSLEMKNLSPNSARIVKTENDPTDNG